MDGGGVAGVGLVVAGGDAPELLQLGEGVLDQVAPAIQVAVEVEAAFAGCPGRDHRRGAAGVEVRPDPVRVERLVAGQGAEGEISGGTPTVSCRWPGSRTKRSGLPSAPARATILEVGPPRERPMARDRKSTRLNS